jgi:hypothetical protein
LQAQQIMSRYLECAQFKKILESKLELEGKLKGQE